MLLPICRALLVRSPRPLVPAQELAEGLASAPKGWAELELVEEAVVHGALDHDHLQMLCRTQWGGEAPRSYNMKIHTYKHVYIYIYTHIYICNTYTQHICVKVYISM